MLPPDTQPGPSLPPPSPEEQVLWPARKTLQERVGQGIPHCSYTEVGYGTEGR